MPATVTNGHSSPSSRKLSPGIYAPIPSFFLPGSEDLDLDAFKKHVVRIAEAGVGPLLAGSMGEAHHLSHTERVTLIQSARKALDAAGLNSVPLIVGTGAGSTRESVELSIEAAEAGADFSIVIPSGYFAGAFSRKALKAYFEEVSAKSPIPVIIYNYPGASGGLDMDSDLITELAYENPNIVGVKLTCGNVGKLTRIADAIAAPEFAAKPRKNAQLHAPESPFLVLGGFIDFLTPSAFANAHGAITGLGNVAPHAIAKLFEVSVAATKDLSLLPEAQRLQGIIARGDFTIAKGSIAGTKYILDKMYGYGGSPRKPLLPIDADIAQALWEHPHTQALVKLEREISGKTQ